MRSLRSLINIATVCCALLLIFVGGPVASDGQAHPHNAIQGYGHQAWQAPQGLPQDSVQTILQTRDGFLWVGTERGLARFDGLHFAVFKSTNAGGIKINYIEVLYESRDATLWIGTRDSGLIGMKGDKFAVYPTANVSGGEDVKSIQQDRDGSMWIGFKNGGFGHLADGKFTVLTAKQGLSSNNIGALLSPADGTLWVATDDGGLDHWDGRRFEGRAQLPIAQTDLFSNARDMIPGSNVLRPVHSGRKPTRIRGAERKRRTQGSSEVHRPITLSRVGNGPRISP